MEVPGIVPATINCHACDQAIDLTGHVGFEHIECPHCSAVLIVPVQFGNFLLVSTLGIGGMGTVYKALALSLNRFLALKILRKKLATSPEFIENFAREARAAAAVNHPNIAQVYSFGEQDGQFYLAMELLERGSLDDRLARLGKIAEADVLDIAVQIAQGLRAAAQRQLLHRDIKPGNVLFNDENMPKLVDFGLARPPTAHDKCGAAEPIWGTPYYVAPEKLFGQPEDVRSDIYSLGATLFHALAGRPPFEAKTAEGVVAKHATTPAHSLKTYVPTVHEDTLRVISRMLAKNPAERQASYDELIHDLHQAQQALKRADHGTVVTTTGERIPILSIISTLALLVLTFAVVTIVWFNREKWFGIVSEKLPTPSIVVTTVAPPIVKVVTAVVPPVVNVATAAPSSEIDFAADEKWTKLWATGNRRLNNNNFTEALTNYEDALLELRSHPAHQRWLYFFEAVTLVAADRAGEVRPLLLEKAHNPPPPVEMPKTPVMHNFGGALVGVLLDEIPPADAAAATNTLPKWAAALTTLTLGLKHLEAGEFAPAAAQFQQYATAKPQSFQRWAYQLQPLAENLAQQCEAAAGTFAKITTLEKAGQLTDALALASNPVARVRFAVFKTQLQERTDRLQKAIEDRKTQAETEQHQREEQERQRAAAEVQKSQELDTLLAPFWKNYDFKNALAKCDEYKTQLQTAAAKQAVARRSLLIGLLMEFKTQLSKDFPRRPFDSAELLTRNYAKVSGRLSGATDTQLVFSNPYGELVTSWNDLPPTTWIKLGEFYANNFAAVEKPELRARRYLQLAAFCKQYAPDHAEAFSRQAVQLLPTLQTDVDQLFPAPEPAAAAR